MGLYYTLFAVHGWTTAQLMELDRADEGWQALTRAFAERYQEEVSADNG